MWCSEMLWRNSWILILCVSKCHMTGLVTRKFPDDFLFGAATSSYQTEGAWNLEGKSENIWDHLTHSIPCLVKDCANGDIADDSYHNQDRDLQIMRELGLDYYKFSLSWTRILPTSFPNKMNQIAVDHYDNIINNMIKYNIKPMVTIYHFDLPQTLQKMGGWANPLIIEWFGDYARTVYMLFGDRVKTWITINEPHKICYNGYGDKTMAPALNVEGIAEYLCAKNVLLAHAKAYRIYEEEFKPIFGGEIGISIDADNYEAATEEDLNAAEACHLFTWEIFAHPIFSESGDFPNVMKSIISSKSVSQGFTRSRLPNLTPEEVVYIRGTSDFFGLNHHNTLLVYRNASLFQNYESPSLLDDLDVMTSYLPDWIIGPSNYTKYVPWGFRRLLNRIKDHYRNPKVYIMKNGYATFGGLKDDDRVSYMRGYLDALLDAIEEGCDIKAYTAWSLMDNFEWLQGYTQRFGLYEVNYMDPHRPRTPRKSAFVYRHILHTRTLDFDYEPDANQAMTIDETDDNIVP